MPESKIFLDQGPVRKTASTGPIPCVGSRERSVLSDSPCRLRWKDHGRHSCGRVFERGRCQAWSCLAEPCGGIGHGGLVRSRHSHIVLWWLRLGLHLSAKERRLTDERNSGWCHRALCSNPAGTCCRLAGRYKRWGFVSPSLSLSLPVSVCVCAMLFQAEKSSPVNQNAEVTVSDNRVRSEHLRALFSDSRECFNSQGVEPTHPLRPKTAVSGSPKFLHSLRALQAGLGPPENLVALSCICLAFWLTAA